MGMRKRILMGLAIGLLASTYTAPTMAKESGLKEMLADAEATRHQRQAELQDQVRLKGLEKNIVASEKAVAGTQEDVVLAYGQTGVTEEELAEVLAEEQAALGSLKRAMKAKQKEQKRQKGNKESENSYES